MTETVLEASRCKRCGRMLTNPTSRAMGMGPVCASKQRAQLSLQDLAREAHGVTVTVNGRPIQHIVLHSPTGLEWGYGGSGPADLALSILTDYLRRAPRVVVRNEAGRESLVTRQGRSELAERLHQAFKADVIAGLPHESWQLTGQQVAEWLGRWGIEVPVLPVVYEGRRLG